MKLTPAQIRALRIAAAKDTGLIATIDARGQYDGIRDATAWSLHRIGLFQWQRYGIYEITPEGRAALAEVERKP